MSNAEPNTNPSPSCRALPNRTSLRAKCLQTAFQLSEVISRSDEKKWRLPEPNRILVLTAYTPDIASYGDFSAANKERYARRHGYDFRACTTGFDTSRPPAWSKIKFIRKALRTHDWVFWTDADALVMNFSIRLEDLMTAKNDLVLSEALTPYAHINTGHLLIRASLFSRLFLGSVWRLKVFTHDSTWEQRAINHLLLHYRFSRVEVKPSRCFNSFAEVPDDPTPYESGDFIVHFPGLPNKLERLHRFNRKVQD